MAGHYNGVVLLKPEKKLLCVSCLSANDFLAILFWLLARSSSNSPRSLDGFRQTLVQNLIQFR